MNQDSRQSGFAGPGGEARQPVPIRRGTLLPAVFCVHPSTGGVGAYAELAGRLGAGQQLFGLASPGMAGEPARPGMAGDPARPGMAGDPVRPGMAGDPARPGMAGGPTPLTVPEMARDYLDRVRRLQPAGPYLFAGWSMGCYVAVEMACQAMDGGERVGAVYLIAPPYDKRSGRWRLRRQQRATRTVLHDLDRQLGPGSGPPDPAAADGLLPLWDLDDDPLPEPPDLLGHGDRQRLWLERINLVNVSAGIRYRAGLRRRLARCDLPAVLFLPRDEPADGAIGQWRGALRPEPAMVPVPGLHQTVVRGAGARAIGQRLRDDVDRLAAAYRSPDSSSPPGYPGREAAVRARTRTAEGGV